MRSARLSFAAIAIAMNTGLLAENTSYRKFRVEEDAGEIKLCIPIPDAGVPLWAEKVGTVAPEWKKDRRVPYFEGPITYVRPPASPGEPFYSHNHQPSVTWLPNGDLLAIWYSTDDEKGTELTVLASRLRSGAAEWDDSSEFFKAENRNMHGSSIFHDGRGTIFHFNGMGPEGGRGWEKLALLMRKSGDNGVTWSAPGAIDPRYRKRNQVISGTRLTKDGVLIQPCDAVPGGAGGTALNLSRDGGVTWSDPGEGQPGPAFRNEARGLGTIAGIHGSVVELMDGRWLALGRGDDLPEHPDPFGPTVKLLNETIIKNVDLKEQPYKERIKAIETLARSAGIDEDDLSFEWAGDSDTARMKGALSPVLKYEQLSLLELVRYTIDKSALVFRGHPGKLVLASALSPAPPEIRFMPMSISEDEGENWTYSASPFPPIAGGQRLVLMRLQEGPLLLVSFTNTDRKNPRTGGLEFSREDGTKFTGHGMFAAISEDEGKTWPVRKLITPGTGDFNGGAWTRKFTASPDNAEHAGYLASTQAPDGTIHLRPALPVQSGVDPGPREGALEQLGQARVIPGFSISRGTDSRAD